MCMTVLCMLNILHILGFATFSIKLKWIPSTFRKKNSIPWRLFFFVMDIGAFVVSESLIPIFFFYYIIGWHCQRSADLIR